MKTIICIVGKSGSGKTTIAKHLEIDHHIPTLVSFTTRPMRPNEGYGIDHHFVNAWQKPAKEDMLAYTKFGGYEYWVHKNQIDAIDSDVFTYVIDEDGVRWLRENHGDKYRIISVYVDRQNIVVDQERRNRDKDRIALQDYDVVIFNDGAIGETCKHFISQLATLLIKDTLSYKQSVEKYFNNIEL